MIPACSCVYTFYHTRNVILLQTWRAEVTPHLNAACHRSELRSGKTAESQSCITTVSLL